MRFFIKPRLSGIASMLIIANLLAFLASYIPNYIVYDGIDKVVPDALIYVYIFLGEFVSFMIITLSATFIAYRYLNGDKARALILPALALSATKCIYNLPYYYLYETANGNDWLESTLASLLINLFYVILDLAIIALLALIAVKITSASERSISDTSDADAQPEARIMALNTPEYKALFSVALAIFVYKIVFEIVTIASGLAEYGSFRTAELIYIVARLVFFVLMLLISYILQAKLYNYYRKVQKNADEN